MKIAVILLAILLSIELLAQTASWQTLPNSPSTTWRHDDLSFINGNTGWVIYDTQFGGGNNGKVYKTTNGGSSWIQQLNVQDKYLRCIAFADSLHGWVGTLGNLNFLSPTPILYKTSNGGLTWDSVTFQNNRPAGLCGISVVDRNNIFACGRVQGPSYFIKSTNGGSNWISQSMSAYCTMLIDCKFFTADSGFVVGGLDSVPVHKSVILFTSNGGNTWTERYRSSEEGEICWKISFIDRITAYVSLDNYSDTLTVLKSTNGGTNWFRLSYPIGTQYFTQGIGFLNENTGWAGGDIPSTYKTTDGGITWQQDNWGRYMNRIRFINDTIGYSVGQRVYKYTTEPIGIHQISTEVPAGFSLHQNFPNPFNPGTKIKFELPGSSFVTIKIYNSLGKEISTLANENLAAGTYSVNWDASSYPSGIYFYRITTREFSESKKMILIK